MLTKSGEKYLKIKIFCNVNEVTLLQCKDRRDKDKRWKQKYHRVVINHPQVTGVRKTMQWRPFKILEQPCILKTKTRTCTCAEVGKLPHTTINTYLRGLLNFKIQLVLTPSSFGLFKLNALSRTSTKIDHTQDLALTRSWRTMLVCEWKKFMNIQWNHHHGKTIIFKTFSSCFIRLEFLQISKVTQSSENLTHRDKNTKITDFLLRHNGCTPGADQTKSTDIWKAINNSTS